MFPLPQTEFRFDFRQSSIGHNTSSSQTELTSYTKCSVTRQCWFIPWFAHSMRHSILHGRRHWIAWLSATWNNSFATHTIWFGSIMLARVTSTLFIQLNSLYAFAFCPLLLSIQSAVELALIFNFCILLQTSQWRTHIGCTQSQRIVQQ